MRPIDGDSLKEEISNWTITITGVRAGRGVLVEFMREYRKTILRTIDEQPTIEQYGTWIPCSERLPNKPEFGWDGYLVQDAYIVKPYDAYWNGKCWTDIDDNVLDNIVAWMPLPEPYGEE